ncbi:MAG: NUMOD3 domain-containing DNA-binding protein, partial [Candidatus Paceibacterota bacterium]
MPFCKGHKINLGKKKKPHSSEAKLKISLAHKGKKLSEEHKRKIGLASKGKGKRYILTKETRQKMSIAQIG